MVVLAAASVAGLVILPVAVILGRGASLGADAAVDALIRPRVGDLLLNSLSLMALTVSACVVLGVGAAWLVERTTLPGRNVWRVLLVAPLAVPAFVTAFGWITVSPGMNGLWGAALVTSLAYFPFVFLPVAAVLRGLDQAAEDTARALGLSPWATFRRVVLPQCRAAISGGALLVGLHVLAEYGVLEMMRFPTFTTAILEQVAIGRSTTTGALLAGVLVVLCILVLALERLARGHAVVARHGRGTHRQVTMHRIGPWATPSMLALAAVIIGAVGVPVAAIVRWLAPNANPFSAELGMALLSTIELSAYAAIGAVLAALPVAWLAVRARRGPLVMFERATYLASALPGVVVALAFVTLSVRYLPAIYQTGLLLIVAYVVLFLPRAVVAVRAGLEHAPPALVDTAKSLGTSGFGAMRRVVLPLVARPIAAGAALVFLAASTELTATLILAPTGVNTLATGFWAPSDELDYVTAAPYALALVVLSLPLTFMLTRAASKES
ncbi:ABC transporter permease subunit [Epidermidibacterium keratini]|uniref:ABC transporter permease subunit n=1 Tax=Epidermidibacterium keratini TaxID=1891644 RepID=A0A7L4YTX1_9ACTN|nr:ABC transporter permease subunit [Epidermidibacterium keratini]